MTVSANLDGIVLSDFAYVQVALKRDAGQNDSILFVGQASDVPLSLLPLIDSLFPAEYRFIRQIPSA